MTGRRYAEGTKVSAERSRDEIERTLKNHGATSFAMGWEDETGAEVLMFKIDGRMIRFRVQRPAEEEVAMAGNRKRAEKFISTAMDQEHRRRWRALLLIIKAKLEVIGSGYSTVDREFMADLVLPDGTNFGDWAGPQISDMYRTGTMPPLLPGIGETS